MSEPLRIRWTEPALTDLMSTVEYVAARESFEKAHGLGERLITVAGSLAQLPERGRVVPELGELGITEYRELISRPYRICYRIHGRDVAIVAVLDGRRDLEEVLMDRALRSSPEGT
jgi:toxin ParE1/3/4